jgi:Zn-dependent alcohol dehydrogenase
LGCGLTTALGIINIESDVKFGESVVIAGCGGVGLNLLQSAKLANAFPIIGIDIEPGKESLAKKCGADFFVKSGSKELEEILAEYSTQKLIDVAIDTTGSASVIANLSTRLSNSGRLILVGQPKPGQSIELPNALDLFGTRGKSIHTTQGGKTNPTMDIPRYVNLEKNGKLSVDSVVTHKFALSNVNDAFDVLRSGLAGRIMIEVANG